MMTSYVALTTLTNRVRLGDLACVAATLQTQMTRDIAPVWGASAVIAAVPFDAIPAGYAPLIVGNETINGDGVYGLHATRDDETPYALVPEGPNWPLAAGHMLLQMLLNPSGSVRPRGPSPLPGQGLVEYVLDVCAPCQDIASAYAIDGIAVPDFVTPRFFGARDGCVETLSFNGAVARPFEPGPGGAVTWLADDGKLYQARGEASGLIAIHGGYSSRNRGRMTMREFIEALTPDRLETLAYAPLTPALLEARQNAARVRVTNMRRYGADIAWRFGRAADEPAAGMPGALAAETRCGGDQDAFGNGAGRSGQHAARGDIRTTARTAS